MNAIAILTAGNQMKITVEELVQKLEQFPDDMQVLLSADEEGNTFYSGVDVENHNNIIVLYPSGSPMDIDEAENFQDEEDEY